jgi:hypothetical protein
MIEVTINTRQPLYITAKADDFGRLFAAMASDDQVSVLRAIVEHMRPHKMQWDYIAIELKGKPENKEVAEELFSCLHFSLDEAS